MKKTSLLVLVLVSIFFLFGCTDGGWMGPPPNYKDIEGATMPITCEASKNDTCEAFECMVDYCECKAGPDRVFMEAPGDLLLENEEQVKTWVNSALMAKAFSGNDIDGELGSWEIDVSKINNIFYNVFVDYGVEQKEYVVAIDGTIIKTVCDV